MPVAAPESRSGSLYIPRPATIERAEMLTAKEKFFRIGFPDGEGIRYQPGQFVEVSVLGYGEAPISICSSPAMADGLELTVREVGTVTAALHRLPEGSTVGIRGPFGVGFDLNFLRGKDLVIIGGGIGIVPLRSLILHVRQNRSDFGKVSILYGARSPAELLFRDETAEWAAHPRLDFRLTVDRGTPEWKGNTGVITTLIPPLEIDPVTTYAVICGPPIMYKFVILALRGKSLPDNHMIVSLERRMKCGVGKCGHCQMNGIYVCQDGPVFFYHKIKDLPESVT
ncbi:MAG: FAD/NAD(P)-binding protein [Planctomycetes bacterium]|nr:FAD/NAD(P)-binding protein [Planctomycetota bacterium]